MSRGGNEAKLAMQIEKDLNWWRTWTTDGFTAVMASFNVASFHDLFGDSDQELQAVEAVQERCAEVPPLATFRRGIPENSGRVVGFSGHRRGRGTDWALAAREVFARRVPPWIQSTRDFALIEDIYLTCQVFSLTFLSTNFDFVAILCFQGAVRGLPKQTEQVHICKPDKPPASWHWISMLSIFCKLGSWYCLFRYYSPHMDTHEEPERKSSYAGCMFARRYLGLLLGSCL